MRETSKQAANAELLLNQCESTPFWVITIWAIFAISPVFAFYGAHFLQEGVRCRGLVISCRFSGQYWMDGDMLAQRQGNQDISSLESAVPFVLQQEQWDVIRFLRQNVQDGNMLSTD